MLNVLIVDDEPLVRIGICHSIEWQDYGMQVLADVGSAEQAIHLIEQNTQIDIVFTDVNMPDQTGLDLLRWIRQNHPEIMTVLLSYHNEFSYVQEALRYGAADYILKEELGKPKFQSTMSGIAEKAGLYHRQTKQELISDDLQNIYFAIALFSASLQHVQLHPDDLAASDKNYPIGTYAQLLLYKQPLDHEFLVGMEQRYQEDVFFLTFEEPGISLSDLILCVTTFISRDFYFVRLPHLRVYSLNASAILAPVPKLTGPEYLQLEKQDRTPGFIICSKISHICVCFGGEFADIHMNY